MNITVDPAAQPASGKKVRRQRLPFTVRRNAEVSVAYGRFVGIMRVLLPTIATALIIIVALWPQLSDQQRRYSIAPTKVDEESTRMLTMVNGVYTGVDDKQRPFTLTAASASLTSSGWSDINMTAPKADLLLKNGSWVAVTSEKGRYDRASKMLELQGAVNLFHDSGYEFRTELAIVDMKAGDAHGSEPVEGQGPFGNLKAEGFVIHNRGERIEFTGKSKLILYATPSEGK